jgi:hypothetical protein
MTADLADIADQLLDFRCQHIPERSDTRAMEVDALLTQANHLIVEAINHLSERDR